MNQITSVQELKGKVIVNAIQRSYELWLKFHDDSFAVLIVDDTTNDFGYKQEVAVSKRERDKTEYGLVKLGLITDSEHKNACDLEEIEQENRRRESVAKKRKIIKDYALDQLKKLSDKYKTNPDN